MPDCRGLRLVWVLALFATAAMEAHAAGAALDSNVALTGRCSSDAKGYSASFASPGWTGWGATPSNARFQSAAGAGLTADRVRHLRLKWAFGFPGASMAFSQPALARVRAHGGSLNGRGATVAGGMVFVNSGYSRFGEAPGNVLLAFSTQSK